MMKVLQIAESAYQTYFYKKKDNNLATSNFSFTDSIGQCIGTYEFCVMIRAPDSVLEESRKLNIKWPIY